MAGRPPPGGFVPPRPQQYGPPMVQQGYGQAPPQMRYQQPGPPGPPGPQRYYDNESDVGEYSDSRFRDDGRGTAESYSELLPITMMECCVVDPRRQHNMAPTPSLSSTILMPPDSLHPQTQYTRQLTLGCLRPESLIMDPADLENLTRRGALNDRYRCQRSEDKAPRWRA